MTTAGERVDDADNLDAMVAGAQRGDEDAFRRVYRLIHPGLLRYVRALVGQDAEDVASEAWLQIARGFPAFRGDGADFRGWAATIARHRALDHLRATRRRPAIELPNEAFTDIPAGVDPADEAIGSDAVRRALALIASLPPDQAEAVLLRVVMGLDTKAAARVLGKRAGAVRTAAYRGLRRLASELDRDPDAGSIGRPTSTPKGTR